MKAVTWHGKRDVRVDHVALDQAADAYAAFQKKQDDVVKVVFQP